MIRTIVKIAAAKGSDQDRAAAVESSGGALLLLADGAGGTRGGRLAAELFVSWFTERADHLLRLFDLEQLVWAFRAANLFMNRKGRYGECTGVAVAIRDGMLTGGSVGGSCAWMVSGDTFVDLTERQERKPLLGHAGVEPVTFGPLRLEGRVLLASDGLVKYARRNAILTALRSESLNMAAEALIALPRLPSGDYPDDVSVVIGDDARD